MTLTLLPAVDVADGQAVRLVQGAAGSETHYGAPLDAAMNWQNAGAEWIHLVDLDAAFGRGSNYELLKDVVGKLDVDVELSGGIRDTESLEAALAAGAVLLAVHGEAGEVLEQLAQAALDGQVDFRGEVAAGLGHQRVRTEVDGEEVLDLIDRRLRHRQQGPGLQIRHGPTTFPR